MPPAHTPQEILHRLEVLYRMLNDHGFYVKANTVALAIEYIEKTVEGPSK